jgi:lysozyme family protein
MADFLLAFERTLLAEGGYKLHTVAGDRGGMTYAGIARNMNPQWRGWAYIDRDDTPPADLVRDFYRDGYWRPLRGDDIADQRIADSIYDFAVNSSAPGRPVVAAKLAQAVVGTTPDGIFGPRTVIALNEADPERFVMAYALAKLRRYAEICNRDRLQSKFLLGWLNRTLKALAP